MLHLSSIHYYAFYYVLLCLLHHQQQALSVTIIIDGATTNEWATRDEYQRLVDNPVYDSKQQGDADGPLSIGGPRRFKGDSSSGGGSGSEQSVEQILRLINGMPSANRLVIGGPVESEPNAAQDVQNQAPARVQASSGVNLNELEGALDQLEVIERERMEQMKQLKRLKSLERVAEGSVANALAGGNSLPASLSAASHGTAGRYTGAGARTISDLVPTSDDDLEEPGKHLVERETPKKYCGQVLVELLDVVCKSRFYAGESEPQVVNPTIKTKRSVDYAEALAADTKGVTRRRQLRTLQQPDNAAGDGGPLTNDQINNYKENRINDGSNNHNQQYLSSSSNSGRSNQNNNNNNNSNSNSSSAKSKQSKAAARLRRIRGVNTLCCQRGCRMDELRPYCAKAEEN